MKKLNGIIVAVALVGLCRPAIAVDSAGSRATELREQQRRLARMAGTTKGGPQHLMLLEERRLQRLIDDLEAGRSVDASEIDEAIRRAQRMP